MDDWSAREKSWKRFREATEKKKMERLGAVPAQKKANLGHAFSRARVTILQEIFE